MLSWCTGRGYSGTKPACIVERGPSHTDHPGAPPLQVHRHHHGAARGPQRQELLHLHQRSSRHETRVESLVPQSQQI